MADPLTVLIVAFGLLFVVGSMAATGLSVTPRMMIEPLRDLRLLALTLLANFIIVPVAVIGLAAALPLPEDVRLGMTILALSAGAPFVPKLAQFAKGDVALSVGLITSLMVVTVAIVPFVLPLVLSGVAVAPWDMAKPLVGLMLLPLGVGLAFRRFSEPMAEAAAKILHRASSVSVLILVFLFMVAYWDDIVNVTGTGAALFSALFVILALVTGYLLGGRRPGTRRVVGLATAQRNIEAAIIIASINFVDRPQVEASIIIATLVGLPLLMLVSGYWGRRTGEASDAKPPGPG
jgi:predicted Na+-dependent transporter